ncbi:MAG: MgtC/SapB family protein [Gammaproteobacteria bacterium]|nr:MgtC/SapB family protein [Gammaproteobacteria bacterium]
MQLEIEWPQIIYNLWHLAAAFILAMPIALDRERSSRGAGLRTFPLVAVAACGYTLVGISVLSSTDAEARVLQGLITGIGFIGGGAILKSKGSVTGTATAASIWNTGLIGMAVAFDRFEIAILMSALNFVTLRYVERLKPQINSSDDED